MLIDSNCLDCMSLYSVDYCSVYIEMNVCHILHDVKNIYASDMITFCIWDLTVIL